MSNDDLPDPGMVASREQFAAFVDRLRANLITLPGSGRTRASIPSWRRCQRTCGICRGISATSTPTSTPIGQPGSYLRQS